MIKHLLVGTFLLASPVPNRAYSNNIYKPYNRVNSQSYTAVYTNFFQYRTYQYSMYAYNSNDEYQMNNTTLGFRTTNIICTQQEQTSTHYTYLTFLSISEQIGNVKREGNITINNNIPFPQLNNIRSYTIGSTALYDLEDRLTSNQITTLLNLIHQRKTTAQNIQTQQRDIYDLIKPNGTYNLTSYWDDSITEGTNQTENYQEIIQNWYNDRMNTNIYSIRENDTNEHTNLYVEYYMFAMYDEIPLDTDLDLANYYNSFYNEATYKVTWEINYDPLVIPDYTGEIIDIPGLIFTILGMPFAWISTAFNVTLFPGTSYAINISHLILSLIAVLIAIFIIKKLIK